MIIYKCENLLNGKLYIGKSVNNIETRITQHFSDAKRRKGNNRFLAPNTKKSLRGEKLSKHSGCHGVKKLKRSNYHLGGRVPSKGSIWERIVNWRRNRR